MSNFKLRMAPLAEWNTANPVLDPGALGIITDTDEIVIGDGKTAFSGLKRYLNQSQIATTSTNGYMSSTDKTNLDNHIADTTKHEVWLSGDTASRPATPTIGQRYFDTTLGKPVWFNGTNWVDATGVIV